MSDYMSNLSGLNNVNSLSTQNASALKDKINSTDYSKVTSEELMDACKSFEAYFLEQAFKGMEKMLPENEERSTNSYVNMFKDNLYKEYAESATERGDGIGIAKMLYEQMKRNYNLD